MPSYRLSSDAEDDLRKIARYTNDKWGKEQALNYGQTLETHFDKIFGGMAVIKSVTPRWPYLYVSKCEHHYVFFLKDGKDKPIILAVLHEKMDMLRHLKKRMNEGN